ncbi:MAG: hypothetical protein VX341_01205 [Bdellovibrionota bacterium]|nr:hypothetical protein [Bdellovibrionota bacterium]
MKSLKPIILLSICIFSLNAYSNSGFGGGFYSSVKELDIESYDPSKVQKSYYLDPNDKNSILMHGIATLMNYSLGIGMGDSNNILSEIDPNGVLSDSEKRKLVEHVAGNYVVPRTMPGIGVGPVPSGDRMNPNLDNLQNLLLENGLERSEYIDKSIETVKAYHEKDTEGFVKYLEDNYEGRELTDLAMNYASMPKYRDKNGFVQYQDVFIKAALKGEPDERIVAQLFNNYLLFQRDSDDLKKLKELFIEHSQIISNYKSTSFGVAGNETILCSSIKRVFSFTTMHENKLEMDYLEKNGSLEGYKKPGTTSYMIHEDGRAYSEQESVIAYENLKVQIASKLVTYLHTLQDIGVDFNVQCNDQKLPIDYLRMIYEDGLLDHIDESSLYLLGLIEKPCEIRNITNTDLSSLCDVANLLESLDNEALGNEEASKKASKTKGISDVQFSYGRSLGPCTILMLDRIISRNEKLVRRSTEVSINSDLNLGKTGELDIKPFLQALKKKFAKK